MVPNEQLAELERLAKEATKGSWIAVGSWVENEHDDENDICVCTPNANKSADNGHKDAAYIAAANPSVIRELIAELREYRHLCAQVRAVYESDSGYGDGMVSMCYRNSQCRGEQVVEAVMQWQQPADESADLRKGIQGEMQ